MHLSQNNKREPESADKYFLGANSLHFEHWVTQFGQHNLSEV